MYFFSLKYLLFFYYKINNLKEDFLSRRDFRFDTVVTIDPITARDLDDALHIKISTTEEGVSCYEIGVHIADVTYFVQSGTELDQSARRRATSVYLVDKVFYL